MLAGWAEAGKAEYPAANVYERMDLRIYEARPARAGERQPHAELFDVWRAGAPGIDMFGPDNSHDFVTMSAEYTQSGNPLFIPEESPGRKARRGTLRLRIS